MVLNVLKPFLLIINNNNFKFYLDLKDVFPYLFIIYFC